MKKKFENIDDNSALKLVCKYKNKYEYFIYFDVFSGTAVTVYDNKIIKKYLMEMIMLKP